MYKMVSEGKRRANMENGRKGGPKSEAGKAKVRLNAVTHGLTAKTPLLSDEDPEEFEALREGMYHELQPVGPLETMYVEWIVADLWCINRAIGYESPILQDKIDYRRDYYRDHEDCRKSGHHSLDWAPIADAIGYEMATGNVANLDRYRTTRERHFFRTLAALKQRQEERLRGAAVTPRFMSQTEAGPVTPTIKLLTG
jgi:hypothetical protein